jgi:hypothetical protein
MQSQRCVTATALTVACPAQVGSMNSSKQFQGGLSATLQSHRQVFTQAVVGHNRLTNHSPQLLPQHGYGMKLLRVISAKETLLRVGNCSCLRARVLL